MHPLQPGQARLAEGPQIYEIGGSSTISYSDVQGMYSDTGNIDADPQFVCDPDPGDGDTAEPCPYDLDGSPRSCSCSVDMDAYETQLVFLPLVLRNH